MHLCVFKIDWRTIFAQSYMICMSVETFCSLTSSSRASSCVAFEHKRSGSLSRGERQNSTSGRLQSIFSFNFFCFLLVFQHYEASADHDRFYEHHPCLVSWYQVFGTSPVNKAFSYLDCNRSR